MIRRLHPAERQALCVLLLLFALSFIGGTLYRWVWIGAALPYLLLWSAALIVGISNFIGAVRDPYPSVADRLRVGAAVPVALIAVLLLNWALAIGARTEASIYLAANSDEFERAARNVGPDRPIAMRYLEGIPDGGAAIIRSTINPTELPTSEQLRLTGEEINRCRRIVGGYLCSFD